MVVWSAPTELPDLRRVGVITLDLETKDDRLRADMGSGWATGQGYICGVSVAWREGGDIRACYFPIRHVDSANFDAVPLFAWLRDLIAAGVRIVTQAGLYDWGWLGTEAGILMPPSEQLEELGALATIVDENRLRYGLDALCEWCGFPGKDDTSLQEGAAALGLKKRDKPAAHIWRMPAHFVGPYAEQDAIATLAVFENLLPVIDREGTREAYRLEIDLLPMVLEMRRRGIRIDVPAAERARDSLLQKRDALFTELSEKLEASVGMDEIGRDKWLASTFDRHGIKYPRTKKGNPSFTAGTSGWMHRHEHWLPRLIVKADKLNNAAVNFLQHYILDHVVKGRVHAEIHPHRSDEGGTRSLRFSYSKPPLQLMTAHDEEIAPLIRGVFLPEEGEVWAKPDISQQEFRFIVHHAEQLKLPRAKEAGDRYRENPDTDFHALVSEWTKIARQQAKNTNFAKAFGAGVRKFAAMIGKSESEAAEIYARYDRELPFVSALAKYSEMQAKRFGYVELYDGARRHFNAWVAWADWTKGAGPCTREEAERRLTDPSHPWFNRGPLRRADTHKALNALIQGSAARHTKLWMRAVWRAGIVPLLQMHDSLDCSVSSPGQAERVAQLAQDVVLLTVPIRVDLAFGRNWADAKHSWAELHGGEKPADVPAQRITQAEFDEINASLIREGIAPLTMSPAAGSGEAPPWESPAVETAPAAPRDPNPPRGNGHDDDEPVAGKILCPFHDDHSPSLHIYPSVEDPHFHCFACGAHGHLNELNERGINWQAELKSPTSGDEDNARKLARAHELWDSAKPLAGTLAERYLTETRGIDVDALPAGINDVLRFHPRCWFDVDKYYPAMIALFRDLETGERAGVHRTFLTPDAQKIDRRMFGRWSRPRAIKLYPANDQLYVAEGIETALAAATQLGMWPAWALGSKVTLEKLPVISGIAVLGILVDRDAHGEAAAAACCQTWQAVGRRVRLLRTKDAALNDFNDLILKTPRADWHSGYEKEDFGGDSTAKSGTGGAPALIFIDMSRWDFEPTPEQEWVAHNRIPRRECVLFSGEGGAGKSIEQLHLSIAAPLEREWLGIIPEQGPAIFIDAEDDEKVLHRRTKAIAAHYDVSIADMVKGGLHLVSWRGCDATLAVTAQNGKIQPTPLYQRLLEAAGDIKPVLIGIAASANVFAGNENDRAQVQQFVGLLTRVAMVANGSVVLISHPSLAGINTETGLSGTTQWHNSVRARYFMRSVKPAAGEPLDTDLRELVFKKNNYGPISETITLRWSNGLFLPVGSGADQAAKEAIAQDVFLTLLKRFNPQNRHVSDKPSANYAPALFAREEEARGAGLTKVDFERAMRLLFQRNAIWNEPCGKPSRPSYRIAIKT